MVYTTLFRINKNKKLLSICFFYANDTQTIYFQILEYGFSYFQIL
ncbi:hypothetical protein I597_1677 [Dokdonia donghaensis DSW-1]|nr:hypothetical protein I597_1677 [Dokdonia donghaensis DSW-1]